eukprot:763461-Hanusia_phi.AAC.5
MQAPPYVHRAGGGFGSDHSCVLKDRAPSNQSPAQPLSIEKDPILAQVRIRIWIGREGVGECWKQDGTWV